MVTQTWRQGIKTENRHDKNSIWAIQLSWLENKHSFRFVGLILLPTRKLCTGGKICSMVTDSTFNLGQSSKLLQEGSGRRVENASSLQENKLLLAC